MTLAPLAGLQPGQAFLHVERVTHPTFLTDPEPSFQPAHPAGFFASTGGSHR
jgi:hypothetical protein